MITNTDSSLTLTSTNSLESNKGHKTMASRVPLDLECNTSHGKRVQSGAEDKVHTGNASMASNSKGNSADELGRKLTKMASKNTEVDELSRYR